MSSIHKVICPYCHITFDRDKVECVQIGRRYAHSNCYELEQSKKTKEEKEKEALEEYIINLFKLENGLTAKIRKQIQTFVKENNYTYSGIRKALIYFYEIKNGNIERANGGLGIVPYIYCEARDYYKGIWEANQRNSKILVQNPNFIIHTKTIKINAPKRELKKQHLFTFLDEEETE